MVYNAMKLFMEINPQLFDDCSHDYTELQNSVGQRQATRLNKWEQLTKQAERMQLQNGSSAGESHARSPCGPKAAASARMDEDTMTHDSQKRLDALKLQDEAGNIKDRDQTMVGFDSRSHQPSPGFATVIFPFTSLIFFPLPLRSRSRIPEHVTQLLRLTLCFLETPPTILRRSEASAHPERRIQAAI